MCHLELKKVSIEYWTYSGLYLLLQIWSNIPRSILLLIKNCVSGIHSIGCNQAFTLWTVYIITAISNFLENSRIYSRLKVHYRCRWHRWQIKKISWHCPFKPWGYKVFIGVSQPIGYIICTLFNTILSAATQILPCPVDAGIEPKTVCLVALKDSFNHWATPYSSNDVSCVFSLSPFCLEAACLVSLTNKR